MRAVFRLYQEAVWYPGRQLNQLNRMTSVHAKTSFPTGSSKNKKGIIEENTASNSILGADVVDPPKYICGRHVQAVFERLGFDPETGKDVFSALYSALQSGLVSARGSENARGSESVLTSSKEFSSVGANTSISSPVALESDQIMKDMLVSGFGDGNNSLTLNARLTAAVLEEPAVFSQMNDTLDEVPSVDSLKGITNKAAAEAIVFGYDHKNDHKTIAAEVRTLRNEFVLAFNVI